MMISSIVVASFLLIVMCQIQQLNPTYHRVIIHIDLIGQIVRKRVAAAGSTSSSATNRTLASFILLLLERRRKKRPRLLHTRHHRERLKK
jgi:hypothetical protein